MNVYIFGAGKAGRALARALRRGGATATVRARRRGLPARPPRADLLILAVRDAQIAPVVDELLAHPTWRFGAVVHCAGALGSEVLAPLRQRGAHVAQLHPLVSLVGAAATLAGAFAHIDGDPAACRCARRAAKIAGLRPFTAAELDHTLYHASAALLANGSAALAAAAADGMQRAGCDPSQTAAMLGALLESVGRNLATVGLPAALTGPVRRGDSAAIAAHLGTLARRAPDLVPLYRALAAAQVPMARALGDAGESDLDAIEAVVKNAPT